MSDSRTDIGACREHDPELWFPNHVGNQAESWEQERQAKAICARCPLRAACLEAALECKERHGIWGGLNPDERVRLKQSRRMIRPAEHGTDSGYYAHRRGSREGFTREPCEECRKAHRAAERAREAAKREVAA